jgi:rhodanese-related sulfurtransferase
MPQKNSTQSAVKKSAVRTDVVSWFETKLEAEWGPYDLQHALDGKSSEVVVLDTRSPDAYEEEHIPQAINIPGDQLEKRLNELPKNKAIVPYCWTITCHLATRAALLLAQNGFRVHELAGGIGMWKEYQFPVTSNKKEPALAQ